MSTPLSRPSTGCSPLKPFGNLAPIKHWFSTSLSHDEICKWIYGEPFKITLEFFLP